MRLVIPSEDFRGSSSLGFASVLQDTIIGSLNNLGGAAAERSG